MKKEKLTAELIRSLLNYDSETGVFRWAAKVSNLSRVTIGAVAGCERKNGYVQINILGKSVRAHRLAWLYVHGVEPDGDLDHKDRNKSNNAIANLRVVTNKENGENRLHQSNSTSGSKGVTWCKRAGKWKAQIVHDKKLIYLGLFVEKEDAADAYKTAAAKYHTHNPLSEIEMNTANNAVTDLIEA